MKLASQMSSCIKLNYSSFELREFIITLVMKIGITNRKVAIGCNGKQIILKTTTGSFI